MSHKLEHFPPKVQALILAQLEQGGERNDSGPGAGARVEQGLSPGKPRIRLRQNQKPVLNKLEQAYALELEKRFPGERVLAQAIRLELGRGIWYKPDFWVPGQNLFVEVKGPWAYRGGLENLKVAARVHNWARFTLVWRDEGEWKGQTVLG